MPVCVRCKTPLRCPCGQPQPIGQIAKDCPLAKGALWIHVTDNMGKSIEGVSAHREGRPAIPTDANGLVIEDPLAAGPYWAVMETLSVDLAKRYDPPGSLRESFTVADGTIAYVPFVLTGKAKVKVEVIELKVSPRKAFIAAEVQVTMELKAPPPGVLPSSMAIATSTGTVDFGDLSAGTYTLSVKLTDPTQDGVYEFIETSKDVQVLPGDEKTVTFEVQALYKKVQFIAHCLLTIPKQLWSAVGGWKARYNGLFDDVADISARVRFTEDTIAKALAGADPDPTVLKIFMIPECFFQGKYGGYEVGNLDLLIGRLQDAVADLKWKDWIFVFGTVNGSMGPGEMFNIAPVVRGGHGGSRSDYTRLIQKSKFSAELIPRAELDREPGLRREPLLTDDIVFQGTENEEKFGKLVQTVLDDGNTGHLVVANGLTTAHWDEIKLVVQNEIGTHGMLRVTRAIRKCKLAPGKPLGDYALSGELATSEYESEARCPTLDLHLGRWLLSAVKLKSASFWKRDPVKRQTGKAAVSGAVGTLGLPFQYQRDAVTARLGAISDGDLANIFDDIPHDAPSDEQWRQFTFTWVPVFKKVLELYLVQKVLPTAILEKKVEPDAKDYAFVSKRLAGPFLDPATASSLPAIKKLQLGVEICADHPPKTLKRALGSGGSVDIHLLASCGMFPNTSSVAARAGGYIFNCDGWSKGSDGTIVTVRTGGPGAPDTEGRTPLTPHSAVGKGGGGALDVGSFVANRVNADATLAADLFGEGPGELHIYPPQDLPR